MENIMKNKWLNLTKTALFNTCKSGLFSEKRQPMSTFALPVSSEESIMTSILKVAGRHALRLSQKQVERFIDGDNIFSQRPETYLIFESKHKEEDVDGLYETVCWKEPIITIKPIGITHSGEVTLFEPPSLSS